MNKVQEKPGTSFQVSSHSGVAWTCLILPEFICDNTCEVKSTKRACPSSGVQSFIRGQSHNIQSLHNQPELLRFQSPGSSVGKESTCSAGDLGSIPGSGRSPGEENGISLQYSCLENHMDRGAWWARVHRVARIRHDLVTKHQSNINAPHKSHCLHKSSDSTGIMWSKASGIQKHS